jgi:hypothetical protein
LESARTTLVKSVIRPIVLSKGFYF